AALRAAAFRRWAPASVDVSRGSAAPKGLSVISGLLATDDRLAATDRLRATLGRLPPTDDLLLATDDRLLAIDDRFLATEVGRPAVDGRLPATGDAVRARDCAAGPAGLAGH